MFLLVRSVTGCMRSSTLSRIHTSSAALTERFSGKIKPQPDSEQGDQFSQEDFRQSAGTGVPPKGSDYFSRNKKLHRPLSPHLTIYQVQLPMAMSISYRVTGAALAVGVATVAGGMLVAPHDFAHYVEVIRSWHLNPALIYSMKFTAAFFLTYHYFNGIRHLMWDVGKGFQLATLYKSGYTVLAVSVASALYLTFL